MAPNEISSVAQLAADQEQEILSEWIAQLKATSAVQSGRVKEAELLTQCRSILEAFSKALAQGGAQSSHAVYDPVRDLLGSLSRTRALQGFSAGDTATFVLSLKRPLFDRIQKSGGNSVQLIWPVNLLIDELAISTMEAYQKAREEVIVRQQREIAELSTPVVKLWDGILALPVIGTLDSQRTQIVMENLLQSIVDEEARDRHHRHNRRADRRYAHRAISAEDGRGRSSDGRRLPHQRHPSADRPDHRSSRRRAERRSPRRRSPMPSPWR